MLYNVDIVMTFITILFNSDLDLMQWNGVAGSSSNFSKADIVFGIILTINIKLNPFIGEIVMWHLH